MALSKSRLEKLENRIRQQQQHKGENEFKVPANWADFARLTQIRSGGDVKKFNPYPYQQDLVDTMLQRSVVVIKSRQLGVSETIISFMLWNACLNAGYLGLVFSKTQADSSLLARRMKRMIASLGLRTATENVSDIEVLGCGRVLFRTSKPDSARGIESVVHCFLDELAFLDTGKELYDALAPAMQMVGSRARVFAVSTPNGKSGFFWDLLCTGNGDRDVELLCSQASKDGEPFQSWVDTGGWSKILLHWRSHPLYGGNPNFLQEIHEKQKLSWEIINQEYNLSFQQAETNVFSADLVRKNAVGEYETSAEKSARYFVGIDTSTDGKDYLVACVLKEIENNKYSLVKLYRKRQETNEFHLYQLTQLIEEFKPVAIGVEVTGGVGTIYVEQLSKKFKATRVEPIRTTGDSKPAMVVSLQLALERESLKYPSTCLLVEELLSFRRIGKQLSAAPGRHDDIVMACCFALVTAESHISMDFSNAKRIKLKPVED